MARVHDAITPELAAFIAAQPLFFVASAPLARDGHVNLSPKGLDSLRVLSPHRVAYLDLTGSGNETAAHLAENGRITLMFCAFTGAPRILRLYGSGTVALPGSAQWDQLAPLFPSHPGARQVVVAEIHRVQTSCGYGVPLMELVRQRDTLPRWAEAKGDALPRYREEKNATSIDGLPAPCPAHAPDAIHVAPEPITSDVAASLIAALNAELSAQYPEPGANHFRLDEEEVAPGAGVFLVARLGGRPVGCGALRRLDDPALVRELGAGVGEVKRMYVAREARGRGVGRALLARLEAEARAIGLQRLVLETGTRQAAALALYRQAGFTDIPHYGEYALSPGTSVCLSKSLHAEPA